MKSIQILIKFLVLSAVFLLSLAFGNISHADTTGGGDYSITIVKYKLSESNLSSTNLPQHPVGSALSQEQAKDKDGTPLLPLEGVSYRIEKVIPSNDPKNPFQVAPGSTSQILTTDANGQANIKLVQGIYRVTELSSQTVLHPAPPVIVQLPLSLDNGQLLNQVFIYPKSGVVSPTSTPLPKEKGIEKIPNTAGVLPSIFPIMGLLVGVILIGLLGVFGIKPRIIK